MLNSDSNGLNGNERADFKYPVAVSEKLNGFLNPAKLATPFIMNSAGFKPRFLMVAGMPSEIMSFPAPNRPNGVLITQSIGFENGEI